VSSAVKRRPQRGASVQRNLRATLEQRAEEARLRAEDRKLDRGEREQAAREMRALQAQLAGMASADRRYAVDQNAALRRDLQTAKPPKNLPAAQATAWIGNQTSLTKVDEALDALEEDPNAVGKKGIIPDIALQRLDPEGVNARAKIADIGSLKIHGPLRGRCHGCGVSAPASVHSLHYRHARSRQDEVAELQA